MRVSLFAVLRRSGRKYAGKCFRWDIYFHLKTEVMIRL